MPDELNRAQREAVSTLSGPLLVLAGAGTGKTRVVTYRIADLVRHGVKADRILAVTFTNKAANEMQERAASLMGGATKSRKGPRPEISTFHSLCVRILRRNIRHLGYPDQFAIYDRGDQESLARQVLKEIQVGTESMRPSVLIGHISRWKTASLRPEQAAAAASNDKEHLAAIGYRRYQRALKAAGSLDFDDLLLCTEELFARFPATKAAEADRFDHLLVDEYQDTNGPQYRIVKALAGWHRNLCVVGDDDQSIYGWRGAEVAHILRFQHDWPDAKVIRLEENYRSTEAILAIANRLIAFNSHRHPKALRSTCGEGEAPRILQYPDEETEAQQVVAEINSQVVRRIADPRDCAILYRTNEQPRLFEQELRRVKLPYTLIGGQSFFDRKEVKDFMAYLRVLVQPRDELALLRIINTPPRGIGQRAVECLLAHAVKHATPLWDVLAKAHELGGAAASALESINGFRAMIETFRRRLSKEPLADLAADLLLTIGYQDEINRQYPVPAEQIARWNSVEEVINALALYQKNAASASLAGFLDDVALVGRDEPRDKESKLKGNAVVLMTLHAAKGLEFSQVYLVGMEEGLLPHHRNVSDGDHAVDEERRLCYVGITRARQRLTMTMAKTRIKWGKPRPTRPSRFLMEIAGKTENPKAKVRPPHGSSAEAQVHRDKLGGD